MSESEFTRPGAASQSPGGYPPSYPPPTMNAQPTASSVTEAASDVASDAGDAGKELAHAAREHAGDLAQEAKERAGNLMDQARSEVTEQASTQQQRLAGTLRSIGTELGQMSGAAADPGYATDLVQQGSDLASRLAGWFENREPGDVVRDVQDYARRRPGMFLAIAAGAGLLAGRVLRGVKEAGGSPAPRPGSAPVRTMPPQGVTPSTPGSTSASTPATTPSVGAPPSDPYGSAATTGPGTATASPMSGLTQPTSQGGTGHVSGT